jgi:hypothetical protein
MKPTSAASSFSFSSAVGAPKPAFQPIGVSPPPRRSALSLNWAGHAAGDALVVERVGHIRLSFYFECVASGGTS